jgi:hypothetical protein
MVDRNVALLTPRAGPPNEAVHVTAARLRIGMNVNGLGWAAARDG